MALEVKNIKSISKESKGSLNEFLNKDIQLTKRFTNKKKQALYNDLFLLLNAGLDIKRVLELVVEEQSNDKEKKVLTEVYNNVLKGVSLSESLGRNKDFSEYEIYSLKIGEEAGQLSKVLSHLRDYYAKKIEQKRLITSALSYPVIVLVIAISAVAFMIGFVVPKFTATYKSFNAELPPITQMLIDFSDNFDLIAMCFIGFLVLIVAIVIISKDKLWFKKLKAKILLSIPFIGDIIKLSKLTQFCQSMELLTSARTPLIDSIDLTGRMLDFYPVQKALIESKADILNGESLSKSLSKHSFFPSRMNYLLGVGEEVNKLEEIFKQLGALYSDELGHKSKVIGTVLEPVLLVFIAILVGFIVVALYMPMFSLSELL